MCALVIFLGWKLLGKDELDDQHGQGCAIVGHHDLIGNPQGINFWNFSYNPPGL